MIPSVSESIRQPLQHDDGENPTVDRQGTSTLRFNSRLLSERIPSYYDAPSHLEIGEEPGAPGGRGRLTAIRKMLGGGGSRESAKSFDSTHFGRSPPSPTGRDLLLQASTEKEGLTHRTTLIHISPSTTDSTMGIQSELKQKTPSMDLFLWPPKQRKQHMRKAPGGLYRVVQSVAMKITDERTKSYVIVEIYDGHQFIKDWKCGDLVHYVNHLGQPLHGNAEHSPGRPPPLETDLRVTPRQPPGLSAISETLPKNGSIHHHYYFGAGRRPGFQVGQRGGGGTQISQVTYRDLRQVFTDGAPVPSIEVRRNCIVVCLPPLSCIIMRDRVFLLVVEDMDTDRLIAALEEMQLRHMGKYLEAQARSAETTQALRTTSVNMTEKSSKRFWRTASTKTVEHGALVEMNKLETRTNAGTSPLRRGISPSSMMHFHKEASLLPPPSSDVDEEFELPMEFEALELLVSAAFEQLDSDIAHLERQYVSTAARVSSPSTEGGEDLHVLSNHVRLYSDRVMLMDRIFNGIMENPELMIKMELSRIKEVLPPAPAGVDLSVWEEMVEAEETEDPNPDVEILLEFFDQELEMFRQRLSRLGEKLESTERLITLKLSLARNTLLRWDVASSMAAVVFGVGTLISGIFGMNLRNSFEENKMMFDGFSIGIALFSVLGLSSVFIIVQTTRL